MAGSRAELCFTSPPYADQREYGGDIPAPQALAAFIAIAAQYADYLAVNLGIKREECAIVRYWDDYIEAAEGAGLKLLSWNIWNREAAKSVGHQTAMFPICHEWILVFGESPVKLTPTIKNKTGGQRCSARVRRADGRLGDNKECVKRLARELGTVVTLPPVQDNTDHPAQYPVGLPSAYIQSFTGDVLDPFSGSGTTLIACEQLHRRCYAIEIEPRYVDVAVRRWQNLTGTDAVLESDGRTFAEVEAERVIA